MGDFQRAKAGEGEESCGGEQPMKGRASEQPKDTPCTSRSAEIAEEPSWMPPWLPEFDCVYEPYTVHKDRPSAKDSGASKGFRQSKDAACSSRWARGRGRGVARLRAAEVAGRMAAVVPPDRRASEAPDGEEERPAKAGHYYRPCD
jgi:hypothetical protein